MGCVVVEHSATLPGQARDITRARPAPMPRHGVRRGHLPMERV